LYSIVYQDAGIVVVYKEPGLPTQPTKDGRANLYELLQNEFPYVGLHHRLDTPVSGLLLLTTQRRLNPALSQAFQERRIERTYFALVLGSLGLQGRIETRLDGQKASTSWTRAALLDDYSALQVKLETGRKHQIRRHFSGIGHPIIGDRRYGGRAKMLAPRIGLHAAELRFTHPANGKNIHLKSKIPEAIEFWLAP